MSFIRFKRAHWIVAMAMLALPGAMLTSCSKEQDPTEAVNPKGDKLVISVLGINDGSADSGSQAKASISKASVAGFSGAENARKVYEFSDVDMAVSVGNTLPVKKSNARIGGKSNLSMSNAGLKAAEEMPSGIKYVVYIYDGTTLVASSELEAGTPGTIEGLDATASYTWVALSYNAESAAPSLTPASGSLDLPENTDVLYASGTVDLADDPTIGVLFDHAFSRIGIEINTIGAFGEITGTPSISVTGLDLATGNIDLLSGEITAGETSSQTLEYADFENVDPDYDDAKIAYVYTAATEAQDLTVTVQNLAIEHADGGVSRTYFASEPADFNTNITPELGKSHHVLLNVVESALTTTHGSGEVKWGRSNLYYRGDNGGDRDYAFYAYNQQTARGDGYFGFGGTIPMKFATASAEGDPCALVYPAGLWRQPNKADFNGLVRGDIELNSLTGAIGPLGEVVDASGLTGLVNIITNLLGNTVAMLVNTAAPNSTLGPDPFVYGQYETSGGAPTSGSNAFGNADSASNNLRFYYNGQISNINVLQEVADGDGLLNVGLNDISADISGIQIANLNLPLLDSYGRSTALWTNEQGTNIVGLVGAGTWGYYGNAGRTFSLLNLGSRFHAANNTGELLNGVSLVGLDVLGTSFKNVRCVRN